MAYNDPKARIVFDERIQYDDAAFARIVVWELPRSLPGSRHRYKYRLAYVIDGACVLRFDNESGKGDHKHIGDSEYAYAFTNLPKLLADFATEIERWNDENHYL